MKVVPFPTRKYLPGTNTSTKSLSDYLSDYLSRFNYIFAFVAGPALFLSLIFPWLMFVVLAMFVIGLILAVATMISIS